MRRFTRQIGTVFPFTQYVVESQCGVQAGSMTENYERLEKILEEYLANKC